jgi:membrane protein DedA with SNARE-associated domain
LDADPTSAPATAPTPADQPASDAGAAPEGRELTAGRTPRPPLDRRHVFLLVAPIIPMWLAVQVGGALFPALSTENPTLLILLSAANRNLVIAATDAQQWLDQGNAVPLILFAVIGVLRLLAPDPFFYAIGNHYGDRAIEWMERRTPSFGQFIRQVEQWFLKAGWLLVLLIPNTYVCLLAGAAGMQRRWFWLLNVVGTVGRVGLMFLVGKAFQRWVEAVLEFIAAYRTPLLVVSFGFVGFTLWREWRSGTTEVQALIELEHEMEEEYDRQHHDDAEG